MALQRSSLMLPKPAKLKQRGHVGVPGHPRNANAIKIAARSAHPFARRRVSQILSQTPDNEPRPPRSSLPGMPLTTRQGRQVCHWAGLA